MGIFKKAKFHKFFKVKLFANTNVAKINSNETLHGKIVHFEVQSCIQTK